MKKDTLAIIYTIIATSVVVIATAVAGAWTIRSEIAANAVSAAGLRGLIEANAKLIEANANIVEANAKAIAELRGEIAELRPIVEANARAIEKNAEAIAGLRGGTTDKAAASPSGISPDIFSGIITTISIDPASLPPPPRIAK